jgi:hypothetical protein
MASDPGTAEPPTTSTSPDDEHLRELIREEIEDFVNDLTDLDENGQPPAGGGGVDPDRPATVRDIETATEAAMRKAMGELQRKPRKTPPAKTAPPPEPPPTDPPKGWWQKVSENLWS